MESNKGYCTDVHENILILFLKIGSSETIGIVLPQMSLLFPYIRLLTFSGSACVQTFLKINAHVLAVTCQVHELPGMP